MIWYRFLIVEIDKNLFDGKIYILVWESAIDLMLFFVNVEVINNFNFLSNFILLFTFYPRGCKL